ncbi:MBG domain-containing protein [Secundilactobacillus yichangensis]|uniref:MBG domain-containing protein n=1 Tax=Secundilactobacillus yichangensis TaxID=2799580 RepID=UPI001943A544|nr:MBG domain-containing protein [Secundilactobacillus yichangensis]
MTKRQEKQLNKAITDHKEHYKMYKSGGAWSFAAIVLLSGALWVAPVMTAKADTASKDTVVNQAASNLSGQTNSSTDGEQPSTVDATTPPAPAVAHTQTATDTAVQATSKAAVKPVTAAVNQPDSNQLTTANLNKINSANLNEDGSVSTDDKTKVSVSNANDVQANFEAEQAVKSPTGEITASDITNTIKDSGVTLVPTNQRTTAGTLVFKNQIDTSKPFTINATFNTENASDKVTESGGGGLGFIIQPVDPQNAGVGAGSDPSANLGIAGQQNVTFIGRDGYIGADGDTPWNQLTVRQTTNAGVLSKDTPIWYSDQNPGLKVPLTEYVTLSWTPQTGVVNHQVTGFLTYSTYEDEARTKLIQTMATIQRNAPWFSDRPSISLDQSVSIAAIGAVGDAVNQRTVTIENIDGQNAFNASISHVPVQINYLSQDGKTVLHAPDVTNVNFGSSIGIDKITDLNTSTFAPRVIKGYQFVKAVSNAGTNSLTITNASMQNDQSNSINVYYTNQVNYTIQPVDAQGNSIAAPKQMTSMIGEQVSAPLLTGYTATNSGIIAPDLDGSVIKANYSANVTQLVINYAGPTGSLGKVNISGRFGETYTIDTPVIPGYKADLSSIQGVYTDADQQLVVSYSASSNSYQIIPVDDAGNVIAALPKTTESSVTETPINPATYAGYSLATNQTLPITQGGKDSYQVHYTANTYQVTVNYEGLPTNPNAKTISGTTGEDYQVDTPVVTGYTADQSSIAGVFGPATTENGAFVVHYTADTKRYKVQPVDGQQKPIQSLEVQQVEGKTGDKVDYPSYEGYTVQPNGEIVPAVSATTPTINVRYTPNASKLTVYFTGLPKDLPAFTQIGVTDGIYSIDVPEVVGYTPDKTVLTGTYSSRGGSEETVTFTANDNSYTITPVDENGVAIVGLSQNSGISKTGAIIAAPDYSQEGYQLIAGQDPLVTLPGVDDYQLKYVSNTQTLKVNYNLPDGQNLPEQVEHGKIGEAYTIVSPTVKGYTPDVTTVTGIYQNQEEPVTVTVDYTPITVEVTVQYAGLDSATASTYQAPTVTGQFGKQFQIQVPDIPGYTADQTTIKGVFSADRGANLHVVNYTGKPASVTINYTGADSNPKAVTLSGVVGQAYSQVSPLLDSFTPDEAAVNGEFTADNAADSTTNSPITVNYHLKQSLVPYRITPVDANNVPITNVPGVVQVSGYVKDGSVVETPDYSTLGYVTSQQSITPTHQIQTFTVQYQKQVSYTMQAVDDNGQPIANLALVTANGIVGSAVTPISVLGYNLANDTYTVPDDAKPIQIKYTPKTVAVTVIPVDGNGVRINDFQPVTVSQTGGTQLNTATLTQPGYEIKQQDAINVPISDTGITVPVTYLKEVTLGLSGRDTEVYTGKEQLIDPAKYTVELPDGSNYNLKASGIEYLPAEQDEDDAVQNVGIYHVQLTESGKAEIEHALAQNYLVSFDDSKTGSLVITPASITIAAPSLITEYTGTQISVPAGNITTSSDSLTATPSYKIAVNGDLLNAGLYTTTVQLIEGTNNANYKITTVSGRITVNPSKKAVISIGDTSKNYDGTTAVNTNQLNITVSNDLETPEWSADDFDLSGISSANIGDYSVKLSDKGLSDLQIKNPNFIISAENVTPGSFKITPAPIKIAAPTLTKNYDGSSYVDSVVPTITGVPSEGVTPVYSLTALNTDSEAGKYKITVDAPANQNQNYSVTTVDGQLTILPTKPQFKFLVDASYQTLGQQVVTITTDTGVKINQPNWTTADFIRVNTGNCTYTMTLSNQGLKALQEANPNFTISSDDIKASLPILIETPAMGSTTASLPTNETDESLREPLSQQVAVTSIGTNEEKFKPVFNGGGEIAEFVPGDPKLAVLNQTGLDYKQVATRYVDKTDTEQSLQNGTWPINQNNPQNAILGAVRQTGDVTKPKTADQMAQHVTDKNQVTAQNKLPQTSESPATWLTVLGLTLLNLFGLLGFKKRLK